MRKLLLLIIMLLSGIVLHADIGSCIVYHAKFYLTDGATFTGCFEVVDYTYLDATGKNEWCNDHNILRLFKNQGNRPVPCYRKIHYFTPRPVYPQKQTTSFTYRFIKKNDRKMISPRQVKKMTFLRAEHSKADWLIQTYEGLGTMLDSLQTMRYWHSVAGQFDEQDKFTITGFYYEGGPDFGYRFINYNPAVNLAEISRLAALKIRGRQTLQAEYEKKHGLNDYEGFERYYQQYQRSLQDWFWQKGILLLIEHGTC